MGTPRSATLLTSENTGVENLSMWTMTGFALGATTTVAVTASGGSMFNCGLSAGVISGSASAPTAASPTLPSFADPTSISGVIPSGGLGIVVMNMGISTSPGWGAPATSDAAFARQGTNTHFIAHTTLGTGATDTPTFTGTTGHQNHLIMGIFAP